MPALATVDCYGLFNGYADDLAEFINAQPSEGLGLYWTSVGGNASPTVADVRRRAVTLGLTRLEELDEQTLKQFLPFAEAAPQHGAASGGRTLDATSIVILQADLDRAQALATRTGAHIRTAIGAAANTGLVQLNAMGRGKPVPALIGSPPTMPGLWVWVGAVVNDAIGLTRYLENLDGFISRLPDGGERRSDVLVNVERAAGSGAKRVGWYLPTA